jgi:hypothetical protein
MQTYSLNTGLELNWPYPALLAALALASGVLYIASLNHNSSEYRKERTPREILTR